MPHEILKDTTAKAAAAAESPLAFILESPVSTPPLSPTADALPTLAAATRTPATPLAAHASPVPFTTPFIPARERSVVNYGDVSVARTETATTATATSAVPARGEDGAAAVDTTNDNGVAAVDPDAEVTPVVVESKKERKAREKREAKARKDAEKRQKEEEKQRKKDEKQRKKEEDRAAKQEQKRQKEEAKRLLKEQKAAQKAAAKAAKEQNAEAAEGEDEAALEESAKEINAENTDASTIN